MQRKINAKLILRLHKNGHSRREIIRSASVSNRSISEVLERFKASSLSFDDIEKMDEDDVYKELFPDRYINKDMYYLEDYDYVHKELLKKGVTLKLLWHEYLEKVPSDRLAVSYSKYCEDYDRHVSSHNYTSHITHKPADKIEVDWAGSKMTYLDDYTGELVTVYLFVACLPYSQYVYAEGTLDMKMDSWIKCNVHMFEFIGGITRKVVCDNLKTGVTKHPKEGEIILNETYESFGEHYLVAIMPTGVRKPKHKASVEGSVGKIATQIIARSRNKVFHSFNEVKREIRSRLEEFNRAPFEKREGSRKEVFEKEERPYLRSLPQSSFILADWIYARKVMNNCHISFEKNFYSVPYQYIGKLVDLKVTDETIDIFYKNRRLTSHRRLPKGTTNTYATHEEDMPKSVQFIEWDDLRIKGWAQKIGSKTKEVIERIFAGVKIKEQAYNPALAVLRLSKKYGGERLEKACAIALDNYRSPRYKHLKAILANNQDIQTESGHTKKKELTIFSRGPEYYGGDKDDR